MVENKVQQEILYREALAMGLDKDDEIVKRRMAQKMQFLAEDVAAAREPTTAELRSWFEKNSAKFAQPPPAELPASVLLARPARRARARRCGAGAREARRPAGGREARERRSPTRSCSRTTTATARPTISARNSDRRSRWRSPSFAPGSWQGPIESGFGWHLVFVDTVIPGRVPAFEEIEPDVKTAWLGEQKALAWEKAYKEMRAKYTVLLPAPPESPRPRRRRAKCRAVGRGVEVIGARIASRCGAARPARRTAGGARPRGAARLPRAQGNRARPVQRAVAHAGARGHAPAGRAEAARRRAQRRGARRAGADRFAGRAALDRRRAGRPRGQAHRVSRTAVDDHRRAGARRAARRPTLDRRIVAPVAAVDRDRGAAQRGWQVAGAYLAQGIEHILFGVDHLLFVLGLLLIVRTPLDAGEDDHRVHASRTASRSRSRRWATRSVPGAAARTPRSRCRILFLGPEIVRAWRGETSFTIRHPWVVAFAFGLLHGFGFASGARRDRPAAGRHPARAGDLQRRRRARPARLRRADPAAGARVPGPRGALAALVELLPGYVVGSLGAFWTIQRVVLMFEGG